MKVLLQELKLVAGLAPTGSHKIVAKACAMSDVYSRQIRSGDNMTKDTPENRKTMKALIAAYRKEIRKYQNKLNKI